MAAPASVRATGAQPGPPPDPAISLRGVSKTYGATQALTDVDLDVLRGERVCLLGPNGAGKSTAIGVMLGLVEPGAGTAATLGVGPRGSVQTGRVGAMLQSGRLPSGVTVSELVDFVRGLYPRPLGLAEALDRAGLTDIAGRRSERLSGGESQRVRFGLAIAGDPELLFLDEPTASMDVEARLRFWDFIATERATRTVLFATHYLEEASRYADRIVVLRKGRIIADTTPGALESGGRTVRFRIDEPPKARLGALPGVTAVEIAGDGVRLETVDADATVHALYANGLPIRDLEVGGRTLEAAFLDLVRSE